MIKFLISLVAIFLQIVPSASEAVETNLLFRWSGLGIHPTVGEVTIAWRDEAAQVFLQRESSPIIKIVGKTTGIVRAFRSYEVDASLYSVDNKTSRYSVKAKDRGFPEIREIHYSPESTPRVVAFKDRVADAPLALREKIDSGRVSPLHVLYQAVAGKCSGTWRVYDGKRRYTVELKLKVGTLSQDHSSSFGRKSSTEGTERQCLLHLFGETVQGTFDESRGLGFWPFNRQQQTLTILGEKTQPLKRMAASAPIGKILGYRR